MEKIADGIFTKSIVQLSRQCGVESYTRDSLDALLQFSKIYLDHLAGICRRLSELGGRNQVNVDDVDEMMEFVGLTIQDVFIHTQRTSSTKLPNIPPFNPQQHDPIHKSTEPWYDDESFTYPTHIPTHLPIFPGAHTYKHSEAIDCTIPDAPGMVYARKRDNARLMQESIIRFVKDHPELHPEVAPFLAKVRVLPKRLAQK